MNPNKKILDTKNNSPWLLCRSKSFPGKFYYFNGSTGETAWCLNETDKNIKKDSIPKVADKTHTHPEPLDPPIDDSTNATIFLWQKNAGNTEFRNAKVSGPSPIFGQAVFPKYVPPDIFNPFVWAWTPMYVASQLPHRQNEEKTQTYDQTQFVPNYSNDVQLLKSNFTPNRFRLQKHPYQFKEAMFDETANFKPFKSSIESQTSKPFMKDEACQTFVPIPTKSLGTQSESDATEKIYTSRSVENQSKLLTKDVEISIYNPPNKVYNKTSNLTELDKTDLRLKLVAKKRKIEYTTESEKAVESTDQSTSNTREVPPPRKRVAFHIEESEASHASSDDIQLTDQSPQPSRMEEPRQPARNCPVQMWYVVADTAALLADIQCIEDFVKSDALCRLLIPHAVYSELEQRSRGDSSALAERQLLRKLALPASHIVVQNKSDELSSEDSILQCCWSLLQEDCHVVLVSNNTNTLNKAKSINLECHTLEEIKIIKQNAAEPQNNLKNHKICVGNEKNKSQNLFMQDLREINSLCLPKPADFRLSDAKMSIIVEELNSGSEICKTDNDKLINSEISNVNDQIIKLSIADSRPVNIRTKQIMKNVFMTTGLGDVIHQATSVNIKNNSFNQNLKDKNNLNCNNQIQREVPKNLGNVDKIDIRINMTDNIKKSRDTIKVSGITKLNNQFNLDEDLEKFYVKTTVVENRIKSRFDEWVCRLNQTMEGVLTEILLREKTKMKRLMPPWNLFEAIQATGEAFKKQPYVQAIIDRFSIKLLNCSLINGKLSKDMEPNDFMKLVGLSMILIEHLKEVINCTELFEADDMLVDLIKNIEDPKTDIDLSLENINTPIVTRSELPDEKAPAGFRKTKTDIEEYLKKHFAAWQTHETDESIKKVVNDTIVNVGHTVVRVCGRNLNMLKIYNAKAISLENKTDKAKAITVENKADKADVENQLKVIRNVKILPAFEERLKNKAGFDLDLLDYGPNKTKNVTMPSDNKDVKVNYDNHETNLSDDNVLDDLYVSASSVNSECAGLYPFVKVFLVKLKSTLVKIFDFIKTSIKDFQKGMSTDKKAEMLLKTELTRQHVVKIIERLKNIIARESGDGMKLKDLLIKSGDYKEGDPVVADYKQTVTKYLEQTQILAGVLERMLSLRNAVSAKEKEPYSDSRRTSPILPTRRLRNSVQSFKKVDNHF